MCPVEQMASYLGILLLVKTVLSFAVLLLDAPLEEFALALFEPLRPHPELELSIVMILAPWLLNSLQFWVLDNVVMHKQHADPAGYKRINDVSV